MAFYFLNQVQNKPKIAKLELVTDFLAQYYKHQQQDLLGNDDLFEYDGTKFDQVILRKSNRDKGVVDEHYRPLKHAFYVLLHEPIDNLAQDRNVGCCLHPQKALSMDDQWEDLFQDL